MRKKFGYIYYSFIFLLLCVAAPSLQAQNVFVSENREVSVWQGNYYPSVFYYMTDDYRLSRDYRSNRVMFDALDELLTNWQIVENIETIEIIGACSPTASEEYNRELSLNRCLSLRFYLRWKHPQVAERLPIRLNYIGIDHLGYSILKRQRPPIPEKEIWNRLQYAAIRLIMRDGSCIVPGADRAKTVIVPNVYPGNETTYLRRDTVFIRDTLIITDGYGPLYDMPKKPVYIALKNNLLYDIALLPNLTAEFYLGNQLSLAVEGNWSWWTFGKPIQNEWVHRIQAAGAEFRYWTRASDPLHGHALGVYGLVGNYDVRFFPKNEDTKGWLSHLSWSAGLSYAYSMPIANKLNLEFGLAFGYVGGRYYQYNYCVNMGHKHEHEYERWIQRAAYNRSYMGPTRVGISLVWLLGTGNNTKNKQWDASDTYYSY